MCEMLSDSRLKKYLHFLIQQPYNLMVKYKRPYMQEKLNNI